VILAHKIEMRPAQAQETYFRKACGTARFAYNWGLARWSELYAAGEKVDHYRLKAELNRIKREQFPWMYEVTKCAPEAALADLGTAWANYFRDLKRKGTRRAMRPKFKRKGRCRDKFYVFNDQFVIDGKRIRLPHVGWVRLTEELRFQGKILGATVSREADRWFVAVQVEVAEAPVRRESQAPVGIDLGLRAAAVLSTGKTYAPPKALAKNLKKLRRLSRQLSRKKKGGSNREKAKLRLARLHRRIANLRRDWTHKLTTGITCKYGLIAVEDLGVMSLMQNHSLARAIADVGWGEIRRQLEYKAARMGGRVIAVDRFFPSSRECRKCGAKHETLTLADRVFVCPACNHPEDRDLHASRKVLREGLRMAKTTVGPTESDACGQRASTGRKRFASRLEEAGRQEAAANDGQVKHREKVAACDEYVCTRFR
jgi:putative transposase